MTRAKARTPAQGLPRARQTPIGDMGAQVADEGPALVALAVTTLRLVCDDGEAPAAARAQAARTLLELVGALRDTRRGVSPAPAEMSPAELDQALARALAREGPGP